MYGTTVLCFAALILQTCGTSRISDSTEQYSGSHSERQHTNLLGLTVDGTGSREENHAEAPQYASHYAAGLRKRYTPVYPNSNPPNNIRVDEEGEEGPEIAHDQKNQERVLQSENKHQGISNDQEHSSELIRRALSPFIQRSRSANDDPRYNPPIPLPKSTEVIPYTVFRPEFHRPPPEPRPQMGRARSLPVELSNRMWPTRNKIEDDRLKRAYDDNLEKSSDRKVSAIRKVKDWLRVPGPLLMREASIQLSQRMNAANHASVRMRDAATNRKRAQLAGSLRNGIHPERETDGHFWAHLNPNQRRVEIEKMEAMRRAHIDPRHPLLLYQYSTNQQLLEGHWFNELRSNQARSNRLYNLVRPLNMLGFATPQQHKLVQQREKTRLRAVEKANWVWKWPQTARQNEAKMERWNRGPQADPPPPHHEGQGTSAQLEQLIRKHKQLIQEHEELIRKHKQQQQAEQRLGEKRKGGGEQEQEQAQGTSKRPKDGPA